MPTARRARLGIAAAFLAGAVPRARPGDAVASRRTDVPCIAPARSLSLALLLAALLQGPAAAQLDYRNLDDHRPVRTEDAYVIEHHAFEFMLPAEYESAAGGAHRVVAPELGWGALRNAQVGVKVPIALADGAGPGGLAGPRLFGIYNFNTEGPVLPGLAARADVLVPLGAAAGDAATVFLKAMATRGFGRTRLHANVGATLGRLGADRAADAEPQWMATLAADRTLLRQSVLLIAELAVLQPATGLGAEAVLAVGVRAQVTPTLVLDGGIARRLTARGPDVALTVGVTHAFGIAALLPDGAR
jgi:hypothetical protein